MAYVKRVPPVKLVLNIKEFNTLIGVLTKNIEKSNDDNSSDEIAKLTKEKLLKYGIPHSNEENIEIDLRLYLNETSDIITQLLLFISSEFDEIDYYQLLLKAKEVFTNQGME